MENIRYLGDAVYAKKDDRGLVLTIGSHDNTDREIVLEPTVLEALDRFRKDVGL